MYKLFLIPLLFASAAQAMLQPCSYSSQPSSSNSEFDLQSRRRSLNRERAFQSLSRIQEQPAAIRIPRSRSESFFQQSEQRNRAQIRNSVNRAYCQRLAQMELNLENETRRRQALEEFALEETNLLNENQQQQGQQIAAVQQAQQNQQQQHAQDLAAVQLQAQAAGDFAAEQAANHEFELEQQRQRNEQLQKQLENARAEFQANRVESVATIAQHRSWLAWLTGGIFVGGAALTAGLVYLWKNGDIHHHNHDHYHNTYTTVNNPPAAESSNNSNTPPPPPAKDHISFRLPNGDIVSGCPRDIARGNFDS